MPPSVIIDADLDPSDNTIYYILETEKIWKATGLEGGEAAWIDVTPTLADGTLISFSRIRAVGGGLVYVIGYGEAASSGDVEPFCLRSQNNGLTWSESWIDEALANTDYTVTHQITESLAFPGGTHQFDMVHERQGDDQTTYNPWAMAFRLVTGDPGDWHGFDADSETINDSGGSNNDSDSIYGFGNSLLGGSGAAGKAYMDDYFGVGGYFASDVAMTKSAGKTHVKPYWTHSSGGYTGYAESWVFWNIPDYSVPQAFDVAPTSTNWLYMGLTNKILASEDGGLTWFTFYSAHGANDLLVDPQLAGALYYWSADGNLNLLVKQTLGAEGVLTTSAMMTETPLQKFGRLARDPSSGRLYAIPNGTELKVRNLGSVASLKTGLTGACGLHVYAGGQKMIMCDGDDIWISDDLLAETPTISAKKGGWSEYSGGVNAHRIVTS